MKKSTLIKLGLVATALVILPRRSSKNAHCGNKNCCPVTKKNTDVTTDNTEQKRCACSLCKIGKCALSAISLGVCCKKSKQAKSDTTDSKE